MSTSINILKSDNAKLKNIKIQFFIIFRNHIFEKRKKLKKRRQMRRLFYGVGIVSHFNDDCILN